MDAKVRQLVEQCSQRIRQGENVDQVLASCGGRLDEESRRKLLRLAADQHDAFGETCLVDSTTARAAMDASLRPQADVADSSHPRPRLLSNPSLRCLASDALRALGQRLNFQEFPAGTLLLRQGEIGARMYVLSSGKVDIVLSNAGQAETIESCHAGEILGEMSLLTGAACTADVRAQGRVEAFALEKEDYQDLTQDFPELEIALSQVVSDRLGNTARDALTGKWIEDYQLTRCVSRGGMGVVYEAVDRAGRVWALKMLHHRFLRKADIIESFLQEGRVLSQLRHKHVVAVRECFVALNTRFLVMDYWDGEDLSAVLRRQGALSEESCKGVLGQLALALAYAHHSGILHLDIKPANILVSKEGHVALTDFGLCKLIGDAEESDSVVGTLPYMPPEQFDRGTLTEAADWYALACTAIELLSGDRLFKESSFSSFRLSKLRNLPSPIWPACNCQPALHKLLLDALHPEADQRKMDLQEVAKWARAVPELMD